jgi:chorismate mutase
MDFLDAHQHIPLDQLRNTLIRLEDTIIFSLIERAQFAHNACIYKPGRFPFTDGYTGSFLMYFFAQVERVHAKVRRYASPDEYPFTELVDEPQILPPLPYPQLLHPNTVNVNGRILSEYVSSIVPRLCEPGDDSNYGSSATRDIECLQAISRRIHYGKFIAEAKFRDPALHDTYIRLIQAQDNKGLLDTLTVPSVEKALLLRLDAKASLYGQDVSNPTAATKVDPRVVVALYETFIIPLTKQVEVDYLLARLT